MYKNQEVEFARHWTAWGGFAPADAPAPRPNMARATERWRALAEASPNASTTPRSTAVPPSVSDLDNAAAAADWTELSEVDAAPAQQLEDEPVHELPPIAWQSLSLPAAPLPTAPTPTLAKSAATAQRGTPNRRERLLQIARENARAPLPSTAPDPVVEEAKAEEKRQTIKDRLWRLMGGKTFDS